MQGQHVDPEGAVQIHQDLQAKQSVAIHWGTFALAYEVGIEIQLLNIVIDLLFDSKWSHIHVQG